MDEVSAVWCERFDGSAIEDFLRDVVRDRDPTERPCVVANSFSGGGRAVQQLQLRNSERYLEASCRLCIAMIEKEIGEVEGNALFRLLFARAPLRQDGCSSNQA